MKRITFVFALLSMLAGQAYAEHHPSATPRITKEKPATAEPAAPAGQGGIIKVEPAHFTRSGLIDAIQEFNKLDQRSKRKVTRSV